MGSVLCAKDYPVDLPSGRSLGPGETADDVDLEHPLVATLIASGALHVADDKTAAADEAGQPGEHRTAAHSRARR